MATRQRQTRPTTNAARLASRSQETISRERVRQIEKFAMRKLRIALTMRGYRVEDLIELGRPSERSSHNYVPLTAEQIAAVLAEPEV